MKVIPNMRSLIAVAIAAFAGHVFGIGAPTGLSVAPIDYTQAACNIDCSARLSWTAPSEGAATGYKIYRRIAAAETPTLAGEVDAATTSFTDLAATVGQLYLYTVTAVNADGESAESDAVSYRKVENVVLASKGYGSWNSYKGLNANVPGILHDGSTSTGSSGIDGGGAITYTFNENTRPKLVYARVNPNSWGGTYQQFYGKIWRNDTASNLRFDGGAVGTPWTLTANAWNGQTVPASLSDGVWSAVCYGSGSWYPIASEIEAYGYLPSLLLTAPSGLETEIVDNQVSLSWSVGANASSYKVYRKTDGGEWEVVASDVTGNSYTDESVERGNTYIYRVAAVSAAGDELSSSERSAFVPSGAQVWWNFLNVKSIAYPGAAAWPATPRPHFLSRDRAGTTLLAAMSTDHGGLPVMTFDLQALVDGDGELLSRDTKAQAWWIYGKDAYQPWQDKGFCWKGAAATEDLIFWANGTASGYSVAVVNRADDSEDTYILRTADGNAVYFWMNGGVATSADGNSLYSNCGAAGEKNKIVKFNIDRANKSLRQSAVYPVEGITSIRNFAVYTVGGTELAVFGEGEGGGKLGVLDLSTGVSTVLSAPEITGKIANVKLADTEDGLFLVAQNDDGFVAVYAFDAAGKTITLEKTIAAATMRALYGASGDFECRNLEMTADGRYAFILCNGGADTRLSVIGATLKTIPESAPQHLSATVDMSTLWQAKLDWVNASGVTATGIRVLRAQTGKPGYAVVADLPLGTTEYTDASVVGGVDYTYAVAYINSFEGKTVAGPAATAQCTPWQSLMPYKKQVISNMDAADFAKVFDGSLDTQTSTMNYGPTFGLQFSEPVILGASRWSAIGWAAGMGRIDGVKISGGAEGAVTLSGSTITGTSGLMPLAQTGTPRDANWFEVVSENRTADFLYLILTRSGEWYGDLREVEFYGAVKSLKDAAKSRPSEAAATVAPSLSANAGTLTWTDEPDETVAVVIYRSRMAEGPYVRIAEVAPGVGTFTDSEASTEVRYFYRAAFVTEYHGVNLEGVQSAAKDMIKPVVVESVLLTENGVSSAAKTYGYAVKRAGGVPLSDAEKAFDGSVSTCPLWYDQAAGWGKNLYIGYNFNEPVKITQAKVVAYKDNNNTWNRVSLRVSPDLAYLPNPGDTSYLFPNNNTDALSWGGAFNPTACTVIKTFDGTVADGQVWEQGNLSTDWTRCAYLWGMAYDAWFAGVREFELWGYTESMWQAVQPKKVVQPVENLTARMDDTTLTLSWTLANDVATAITVKHRVSGGAWAEVASLAGTATSFVTETVAVGRYNEYRIEVSDGTEIVWNEKDFAICPLLSKGTRTVMGCTPTSAWDYLSVPKSFDFSAVVELSGSNAAGLGLTPGTGTGKNCDILIRASEDATPAVQIQRHFVYGNTLGFYAFDDANKDPGYVYHIAWTAEGNASTCFKIRRTGTSYRLSTEESDGSWMDRTAYEFSGDDRIGKEPCLVGIMLSDPNLATLPQIAPCTIKVVVRRGMAIIVR